MVRVVAGSVIALLVAMMAACSAPGDELSSAVTEASSPTGSSTDPSLASASTVSGSESEEGQSDPSDATALTARWQELIVVGSSRSNPDRLPELANPETVATVDTQFFDQRRTESFYTQVSINGATATIEECALFDRPLSTFLFVPMTGAAELVDGQWIFTELNVDSSQRCMPGDLAGEVLDAYENYWDTELIVRNPPDPNSSLLEDIATGEHLANTREIIGQQEEEGLGWKGRPTTNPEFFDYAPGEVVIDDCQLADPEAGIYDLASGEKTDRFPPTQPGQRDGVRTRLEIVEGQWKVAFVGADRDIDCEFAPTTQGIPIVGPVGQS